ncbi:MAG TPA: hypothetical protein VEY88_14180 [Archangium sp.]|nr:hypothetical protein [Archangium sp.]
MLGLLALGAGTFMLWGLSPLSSMREHDARLARIEQELTRLPLPEGTERVGVYSRVGLLSGNGNHCDYVSAMLLRGDVERALLEGFYRQHTVSSPDGYPLEIRIGADGLQPAPEYEDDLLADRWMEALPVEGPRARPSGKSPRFPSVAPKMAKVESDQLARRGLWETFQLSASSA